MLGPTFLVIIMLLSLVIWAGQLFWIAQQATQEGEDPFERVSGAAIFFIAALPVAMYAPHLVDRMADFWASLTGGEMMGGFNSNEKGPKTTPRLIVGGNAIPITEDRVEIGRYDNNDLVLDHPTVSAYHAEIVFRPDGRHELKDRDSRNGTRINGSLIRSAVLKHGDQITLGAMTIHYLVTPGEGTGD